LSTIAGSTGFSTDFSIELSARFSTRFSAAAAGSIFSSFIFLTGSVVFEINSLSSL